MATAPGNHRRPIDPYYDLTHEAGRRNFQRLFNEELTTMGNHRRLKYKNVRFFAVYDFEHKITDQSGNDRRLFISCGLTLSWKLRDKTFLPSTFLDKYNLLFPGEQLVAMASHICRVLDWRFKTMTPFRFLHFFVPFVTLPPREAPLRPVYKLLLKCQYDVEFTKFRPSIMAASALLIFISNELPNQQLSDFESNLLRGFFDPKFQGQIKDCEMKLAPLYGGSPSPVGAATSSRSGVGDHEEAGTSRREGEAEAPIDDDDARIEDRGLFGIELEWHLGFKGLRDDVPKRCDIL